MNQIISLEDYRKKRCRSASPLPSAAHLLAACIGLLASLLLDVSRGTTTPSDGSPRPPGKSKNNHEEGSENV